MALRVWPTIKAQVARGELAAPPLTPVISLWLDDFTTGHNGAPAGTIYVEPNAALQHTLPDPRPLRSVFVLCTVAGILAPTHGHVAHSLTNKLATLPPNTFLEVRQ